MEAKKFGIDVVYTIAAILPHTLTPYRDHFLEILNESRFDKQKPIREATIEAITALRQLPPATQIRVVRGDAQDRRPAAREDPTPRPKEMPNEVFDMHAEKATGR